jgi:hypothetical protein
MKNAVVFTILFKLIIFLKNKRYLNEEGCHQYGFTSNNKGRRWVSASQAKCIPRIESSN